jgi:thioredoxin reductase (NADPH)
MHRAGPVLPQMTAHRPPALFVVDDEPDIASSVAELLRPATGLQVAAFRAPQQALDALPAWDVRLVLADFRMPGMDGIRFLRETALRVPAARRILMTAYPELDVALRALHEARVHHVLLKPLEPEATVAAVRALLVEGGAAPEAVAHADAGLAAAREGRE